MKLGLRMPNKQLLRNLQMLLKSGDEESYLMIDFEPYYIQVSLGAVPGKLYVMAPSNAHIKGDKQLSPAQNDQITGLGLQLNEKSKDYLLEHDKTADSAQKLTDLVEKLVQIYGASPARLDMDLVID
jgi:hypothetical protein